MLTTEQLKEVALYHVFMTMQLQGLLNQVQQDAQQREQELQRKLHEHEERERQRALAPVHGPSASEPALVPGEVHAHGAP